MRVFGVLLVATVVAVSASAEAFYAKKLIFPQQEKHCHGSTIVELPNGDLLAAWFQGSGERSADDVRVNGSRLAKGETEWSPVFVMADTPDIPDCNPVLFLDANDKLWLFWISVIANRWESSLLKYRTSEDYDGPGAPNWTWQDVITLKPGEEFAQQLKDGFEELGWEQSMWAEYALPYDRYIVEAAGDKLKRRIGWMTRTHVLSLPSGRIVVPLYSDGFNVSLAAYSDDGGVSWTPSAPIVGLGPIQPAIVRKKDGTLVSYMRDSGPPPARIMKATSADDGETWTVALDTDLKGSGASVQVCALEDGRWVMIHNDTDVGRHRLTLSMSDDEGETWKWKRSVEDHEPGQGGFAYPSIIQTRDGRIHMTYSHHPPEGRTIAHVEIDPEWIAE